MSYTDYFIDAYMVCWEDFLENHVITVLASQSPRRRELLSLITDNFIVVSPNVKEILPENIETEKASEYLANLKASETAKKFPDDLVIGCDTTVVINDRILGKTSSKDECSEFLHALSGNTHKVITGCALYLCGESTVFSVVTDVEFRKLSDSEIEQYIATGEPFDKAGGYGIQGKGALLVEKINGDYFNVVGLPVSRLNIEIKKLLSQYFQSSSAE